MTIDYDNPPYEKYPDNCERCVGMLGGVRGNENRVDGRVLCDYCSVAMDDGEDREMRCAYCSLPLSRHTLMRNKAVEAIWEQGIAIIVCGSDSYIPPDGLALVIMEDEPEPDDPCDEDFMKEISS